MTFEASDSRQYNAPYLRLPELIHALSTWLQSQNFELQHIQSPDGSDLLQLRKKGAWRNVVGMSSALNIGLRKQGEQLTVEIGAGKWADKAVVGTISMFVLWPLGVTAAFGAWQQLRLPDRVFSYVQEFVTQR